MTAVITVEMRPGMLDDALDEAARIAKLLHVGISFEACGDRVVVMPNGEVAQVGSVTWLRNTAAGEPRWFTVP